jgi:nucleolar protein 56
MKRWPPGQPMRMSNKMRLRKKNHEAPEDVEPKTATERKKKKKKSKTDDHDM